MAFLGGSSHVLYVTSGEAFSVDANNIVNGATGGDLATLFITPGSKPTIQTNIIEAEGVGFLAGKGRARSTVSGSFSFYLPKADRLGSTISQTQGFLLFFKHFWQFLTIQATQTQKTL